MSAAVDIGEGIRPVTYLNTQIYQDEIKLS